MIALAWPARPWPLAGPLRVGHCADFTTKLEENSRRLENTQPEAAPFKLSVFTRRVLQTLAIALWRSNASASHILQFHRRACHSARRVVGSGVVEELVAGPGGGI